MTESVPGETPIDPSHLIAEWDGSRNSLNALEAQNILKAAYKYLTGPITSEDAPFTFSWMLQLYHEMFGEVWSWAGKLRRHNVNIGADWTEVEQRLWSLAGDVAVWQTPAGGLLDDAAELHHRAVSIHPFPNGNGRWSRMLANVWLRLHASPATEWPERDMGGAGAIRAEYLAADARNRRPLVELHRRCTPAR